MNRQIISEQIGSNIKRLRKARKKTQQEIADAIGIHRSVYTRYESGAIEIPAPMLAGICGAIGINPAEVFDGVSAK